MNGSNWWNPILRNECHIFSSKWVDSLCCLMRGRARGQKDRPFLATALWVTQNKKVQKHNRIWAISFRYRLFRVSVSHCQLTQNEVCTLKNNTNLNPIFCLVKSSKMISFFHLHYTWSYECWYQQRNLKK